MPEAGAADGDEAVGRGDGVGAWVGVARARDGDADGRRAGVGDCVTPAPAAVALTTGAVPLTAAGVGGTAEQAAAITAVAAATVASASRAGQRLRPCLPNLIRASLAAVSRFWIGDRRRLRPITEISSGMNGSFRYPCALAPVS
ncbi:MAG TPA: hypothetical protein VMU95_10930 [Trebonia sp.]|nr:hypothetical protein [Trebonia sp.]